MNVKLVTWELGVLLGNKLRLQQDHKDLDYTDSKRIEKLREFIDGLQDQEVKKDDEISNSVIPF